MTTRADLLADAVAEESSALAPCMPREADGWGVGFYQAGEVLHYKRPQAIREPISFSTVVEDIRSHLAIAHVREATVGDGRADNTQPFRMRQWLFAHVGSLAGQEARRERLAQNLPDFLRRNMRGQTDSELLFHVILSFLHESGQIDAVDVAHAPIVSALRATAALIDRELDGEPSSSLTLALTNGRQLYALQRGLPLAWAERDGLPRRDSDRPGERRPERIEVHYVSVASCGRDSVPQGYQKLNDGDIVCIDRDLKLSIESLSS